MTRANAAVANIVGGELSPLMQGRTDLPIFKRGIAWSQNFIALPQGGAQYRAGTTMVHHTRLNKTAVLIPFQFNDQQSYVIEATDLFFRFYKNNSIIVEAAKTITGVTQANPAVVTSAAHGMATGAEVFINNVVGMTQLNGKSYLITVLTVDTYSLQTVAGTNVNSTGYTAYTSGGISEKIYEIATPYTEASLIDFDIQFAQSADTMYLVSQNYAPRKLTRTGHTAWTLATYVRTADPFTTSNDWPRAVAFTDTARLLMAGTKNKPETIYGSKAPTSAGTNYDNFTTGVADTDAIQFTLAPVTGKVDAVEWITNTDKYIIVGTFGTVRRLYGAGQDEPINANAITAKAVNNNGCAKVMPIANGSSVFYVQRGNQTLRSFEYDYVVDGYITTDRNLVSDHLAYPGFIQLTDQKGKPDVMWELRSDGVLFGLTYKDKEDISGWHRHRIGGSHVVSGITRPWGKALSVSTMPRENNNQQLWMAVERYINGKVSRSVEFVSDYPVYPLKQTFYTGQANKAADLARYENVKYEQQKQAVHVDMALTYDGSDYGVAANATVTPSAITGAGITLTASAAVFTAAMVGREIWKKYDENGEGGGRATITGYTSPTVVTATTTVNFNSTAAMAVGYWYLTASTLSGLDHLEGEEATIIADGGPHNPITVVNGAITLEFPASVIHVGYGYVGMLETLNLDVGGVTGSAQSKPRNVPNVCARFLNTLGVKIGTDQYGAKNIVFESTADLMDRPTPLFNGIKPVMIEDKTEIEKSIYILQESPLPCTVLVLDVYLDTADE